jgi:ERCC4-type nuclease
MKNTDFTIIVDTREQKPWTFDHYQTSHAKLDTGDYSIQGLENILGIERKRNVAEIANNITESRFKDVVSRMSQLKHSFILLEFELSDVLKYPIGSTVPKRLWDKIRITPAYLLKHLTNLQLEHNIKVLFCGNSVNAERMAETIINYVYKQNKHLMENPDV